MKSPAHTIIPLGKRDGEVTVGSEYGMMPVPPQWANTQAGKPLRLQAQYQSPGGGWRKGTGQVCPLIAPKLRRSPTSARNTKEMKEGVGTLCAQVTGPTPWHFASSQSNHWPESQRRFSRQCDS